MNIKRYMLQSQNHEDFIKLIASDIQDGTLNEENLFYALEVLQEAIANGVLASRFKQESAYIKAKSYIEEALKVKDVRLSKEDAEVEKIQMDFWERMMNNCVKGMLDDFNYPIEIEVDLKTMDHQMSGAFDMFSFKSEDPDVLLNVLDLIRFFQEIVMNHYKKIFPFNSIEAHEKAYAEMALYFQDVLAIEFEEYLTKTDCIKDSNNELLCKFFKTDRKTLEYFTKYVFAKTCGTYLLKRSLEQKEKR